MSISYLSRAFRLDQRAAAALEFALVAPLFLMTIFGILDYGMQFYGSHVLQGAVSQAARSSTLEGFATNQSSLDDMVNTRVRQVFGDAHVEFTRRAYLNYEDVGKAERIYELPSSGGVVRTDGKLDPGECFDDANGSGKWEADRGRIGNGGPDDIVLYEVVMNFDRMFPFWAFVGQPQESTMKASTLLRNQPYGKNILEVKKICP